MAKQQGPGLLRVVNEKDLSAAIKARDEDIAAAQDAAAAAGTDDMHGLVGHIRAQFDMMRRHRNSPNSGWSDRLLAAQRAFNGQYDAQTIADISAFGGSKIYARLIAMKCRGASALLRDVYLSPDRPWGLDPSDDPKVPQSVIQAITNLVKTEATIAAQAGMPPDVDKIKERTTALVEAARQVAKKRAADKALVGEDKIDTLLKEGGFYKALSEFITDLPLFPFAVMKGPVVRILPVVTWNNGTAQVEQQPRLTWSRISPFDIWWTPGVSDIEDASVIERVRLTRADLNDLLDLPGYNTANIKEVLRLYGAGGFSDQPDATDAERAIHERRENPQYNQSGLITCLEFTGNVQGKMLIEQGMDPKQIPDPERDYMVQAWSVGSYIIKVQMSPSPRKRHSYYVTSFEKVPGTPVGNGLPDILSDIQEASNATLRALINNMSIASGPQVVVNDDRLANDEDGESLYPWKRWHVTSDPMGNSSGSQKPVDFFQPGSNANELLTVYQAFVNMADELSAIPKYMSGSGASGGAGRTASGLAMLMGNASKILQTVAANVDRDVLEPLLGNLFDMIMLTDTSGLLSGEENVRVLGVSVAVQKETQRARQLEFLQITANPIDAQIMGPKGRAAVLRSVSTTIGMDGSQVVPSDDEMEAMQKQSQQVAMQQGQPGHGGMGDQAAQAQGGQAGTGASGDMGPRTNITGAPQ